MVYEARKEPKKAADCYRKVIEFMQVNPTDYDADFLAEFEQLVRDLDPPTAADPPPDTARLTITIVEGLHLDRIRIHAHSPRRLHQITW